VQLVYLLDHFPRLTERFVLTEIAELRRQGDEVLVVARRSEHDPEPDAAGVDVLRLPERVGSSAVVALARSPRRALPALAWAIRARRYEREALRAFGEAAWLARRLPASTERLHAHFAHGSATLALLLARLTGRPFSFTAHAYDVLVATHPLLLRRKVDEAAFVVAVSEFTRARLAAGNGKVAVVRNGVEPPAPAAPDDPPLVLAVARLVEKKGLDTLLRACAELVRRGVRFRCELVGDGPERGRLEALARELDLGDAVRLSGARPHAEVAGRLARARAFALPCRRARDGDEDALPVALVEALAAGVPVVTTGVGGIPEAVEDGVSGLLVPPEDPRALADALERLLVDDALHARLAAGGRDAARAFDPERCVGELRALLAGAAR
jgi:glycosyltransferase involved in cell wall biosynthesis